MNNKGIKVIVIFIILIVLAIAIFFVVDAKSNKVTTIPNDSGSCGNGACISDENLKYGYQVGNVLKDFQLEKFDGSKIDFYDLIDGYDRVVVSLEADWCPDCQRQTDKVLKGDVIPKDTLYIPVYTTYSKEGDSEKQATYDTAKEYTAKTYKDSDIIPYFDTNDMLWNKFDASGTPTNIVLDGNARIKAISVQNDVDTLLLPNQEDKAYKQ